MKKLLLAMSLLPLAQGAWSQEVPAIQANASASASASTSLPTIVGTTSAAAGKPPPTGWPPMTTELKAPAVHLDKKEATAVTLSKNWRDKRDKPSLDADGVLRWVFGNSQTRVVCAPLNICDIEFQPGETINNIRLGDTAFWTVTWAISGSSKGRVTHAAITPHEAGRVASMLVYTDQHIYAIKLVSTETSYTAKTGFLYPDTENSNQENFAAYQAAIGGMKKHNPTGVTLAATNEGAGSDLAHLEIMKINGDNPSWRPLAAYTDGRKTYIQFPQDMQFGDSPTLLGINNDGGLFSSPSERRVIYRWLGDRLIADTVMDRMKLVMGVGSSQEGVMITRGRK